MMKAAGDKRCKYRTESLSKHSAEGREWRETVRSGGEGTKYASRGNFFDFICTNIDFLLILRLGGNVPDT